MKNILVKRKTSFYVSVFLTRLAKTPYFGYHLSMNRIYSLIGISLLAIGIFVIIVKFSVFF